VKFNNMKRVIGLGGIFFKSENRKELLKWYESHLGIKSEEWGAVFPWRRAENPDTETYSAWSPFANDTSYFSPSSHDYMINYQVENLQELLEMLRKEGVDVLPETEESEFGKFGWIIDPEGRKIELWEPPV
jgi:predicted enzyme related to lactoylglutathione lyase